MQSKLFVKKVNKENPVLPAELITHCCGALPRRQFDQVAIKLRSYNNPCVLMVLTIDFHINNGTKIAIALDPLTFILSPDYGGEWIGDGDVRAERA
jgi:hypothetical protein